jgi:pyruvate dehydrogenase E2 component (dihydrolipoamide acetyltransferase)
MPPVRKLARKLGIDIAQINGSGPNGRILRHDVEAHASHGAPLIEPAPAAGGERREPLRGVRRLIAERMSYAHQTIPPVTHVEECDVTELEATRQLANERNPEGTKLTFLPFIVKAVVAALKDYPALNATLDEKAQEIVYYGRYDIGVAVETPNGLVVPVVRSADAKRLVDIARDIHRLAKGAREGTLDTAELKGGTFTVTSPGPFGGLMATPIVMAPQSGILGVHRAIDRPVVRDGQIVVRKIMNLSVTFDHRVLDGMTAARFILDVVRLLEHPAVLALES